MGADLLRAESEIILSVVVSSHDGGGFFPSGETTHQRGGPKDISVQRIISKGTRALAVYHLNVIKYESGSTLAPGCGTTTPMRP